MTDQELIQMAEAAGPCHTHNMFPFFKRFAKLITYAEREKCAKLCDELADAHEKLNQWESYKTADVLAQAILARGGE